LAIDATVSISVVVYVDTVVLSALESQLPLADVRPTADRTSREVKL